MGRDNNYSGRGDGAYQCIGNNKYKKSGNKKSVSVADTSTYSAPIVGLTKVLFIFGTTIDAAAFLVTKSKLAWHVRTKSWHGAAVISRAIEDMEDPALIKH